MTTLHEQAVHGVAIFRKAAAENPEDFEKQSKDLKECLEDCADRNAREGALLRRTGLSIDTFYRRGFPRGLELNLCEYLVVEYLFFACREVRKSLVSEWRRGLETKADYAYSDDSALEKAYNSIGRISWEYADLKSSAIVQRIDRKTLYAVRRMQSEAASEAEREDWEFPVDLGNKIDQEFEKANLALLGKFGINEMTLSHYYRIACESYQELRALKYAAVLSGSAIAAYGIGQLMTAGISASLARSSGQVLRSTEVGGIGLPVANTIPNYGFFSKPEFLSIPFDQITANQLGFQHLAQGLSGSESIYLREPFEIAREMVNTPPVDYFRNYHSTFCGSPTMTDLATMLGLSLTGSNGASGTMLGSNASFNISSFSDSFATLTGRINGKSISKNIRRIGNNISIS